MKMAQVYVWLTWLKILIKVIYQVIYFLMIDHLINC